MISYKIIAGSKPQQFHNSRAKIRLYAGGFGNGKTTALVAETLKIMKDYPGITAMMGRNTYGNLEKTLKREFMKWLPPAWLKSGNKQDNTYVLHNGSTVDFRYISQQNNSEGEGSSNLLSANYGLVVVDQIEDPDITEKDFLDMMGRLREQVPYAGDDPTMPLTGPRMMLLAANPALNWVYKKLVKPIHDLRRGLYNPDLMCIRDPSTGQPVLDDNGKPQPIVEIFEASTYENAQNLTPDFIQGLEATYTGKMRDRYLLGKWMAFDGVVYEEFDSNIHVVPHDYILRHLASLRAQGYSLTVLEGYDLGLTEASCYLLGLVDENGATHIVAGFYERNMGHRIDEQAERIHALRKEYAPAETTAYDNVLEVRADPAIFRKTSASREGIVGQSVADMFAENDITMVRGNNAKLNGIIKVKSYLRVQQTALNPYTSAWGCPKVFISDQLHWLHNEFETYRWKKSSGDTTLDEPVDKNDHGMDTVKYMFSDPPRPATRIARSFLKLPRGTTKWGELPDAVVDNRQHRYA